jgi:hypothetical protein
MSQISFNGLTVPEKVVEYIGFSQAALEKSAAALNEHEAVREKVAALIPTIVDALVSGERIKDTPADREKAAQVLRDPVRTLEILAKVAVHRNAAERALGTPVESGKSKQASANPFCGARVGAPSAADTALFSRLGLTPPAN